MTKGRTSGPGGQHRNKVETKVVLVHTPTGIEAHAGERRSATDNKRVAMSRLRLALAVGVRMAVPLGDARSALWMSRTGQGRISCSTRHQDFPAMLAEALDMVYACGLDTQKAAVRLSCSHSQLIKLLKDHSPAIVQVNRDREARGLHALR